MKNRIIFALSLLLITQSISTAHAAYKDTNKKSTAADLLAEAEKNRQAELENTEWEAQFLPRDPKAKGPISEKLVFEGGKVSVKMVLDKGFQPIAYTLTAFTDSTNGRWETYQSLKEGEQTLSMRGDWYGEHMDGVISMTFDKGKRVETYNFSTQKKLALTKAKDAETAVSSQEAAASAVSASSGVLVSRETPSKKSKS
jgi:hypothetical protein